MASFPIRTARELMDADFEARWSAREEIGAPARTTLAAMLRTPIVVHASCHHCLEPLAIHLDPDGPLDHLEVMAWVGRRDMLRAKACDGL